jgi:NFACT protein RNA binding domain
LIRYGWPEDVWFHVDDLSSAHVYLRMRDGMSLDDLTEDLLTDCAALVKANSIAGCKLNNVYVVYTRWKNLKKTSDMVDGQVGFHRPDNVRRLNIEKNTPIVKLLEKSRQELHPDLHEQQQQRLREEQQQKKAHFKQLAKEKEKQKQANMAAKEARSYDRLMQPDKMTRASEMNATVDATAAEAYEEDFF